MSDIAQLITAMAALVTSLGGALAAVIVATRSGNRQAEIASKKTMEMNEYAVEEEENGALQAEELQEIISLLQSKNRPKPATRRPQQRREGGGRR